MTVVCKFSNQSKMDGSLRYSHCTVYPEKYSGHIFFKIKNCNLLFFYFMKTSDIFSLNIKKFVKKFKPYRIFDKNCTFWNSKLPTMLSTKKSNHSKRLSLFVIIQWQNHSLPLLIYIAEVNEIEICSLQWHD